MDLETRDHDSTLRDKNQYFWANLDKYIHARRVIQEVTNVATRSYRKLRDLLQEDIIHRKTKKIKSKLDDKIIIFLIEYIRSPF